MISLLFILAISQVPSPISLDSVQLQQLVNKSEQQLKALREILKTSKSDADSLKKASAILDRMSKGIEKSIDAYQGTAAYDQALLEIQKKNEFARSFKDTEAVRKRIPKDRSESGSQDELDAAFEELKRFQRESVNANDRDIEHQAKLQKALSEADPGFVPKIEAQAQIGNWQASTRLSAQMTELISTIHAMREELRALRMARTSDHGIGSLIRGAEMQTELLNNKFAPQSGGSKRD